jgi:proline iminopeptidase
MLAARGLSLARSFMSQTLRELHPEFPILESGLLKVSDVHTIYWETSGNPKGKPVAWVHGGPGGNISSSSKYRRFFNPADWYIIAFDQRGCGKSTPFAELQDNNTWSLVADMEKLRESKGIEKWAVFGGSWGSTLALSYAESHPERVTELILRGIFLIRQREIDWFYEQDGASFLFPDYWEDYLKPIPVEERGQLVNAYHKRLTGSDEKAKLECCKAWAIWEGRTSTLIRDESNEVKYGQVEGENAFALAFARIENHYFYNKGFFTEDGWLLKNAHKIKHIPTVIVHGRYDVVCPLQNAHDLKKELPNAELHVSPTAGHSQFEPENVDALVRACEKFAKNWPLAQ